jgi:hypothetical protein
MSPFDDAGNLIWTTFAVVRMLAGRLFSSYWMLVIIIPLVYQGVRSHNLVKARHNLEHRQ